jgi:hypothetical protein
LKPLIFQLDETNDTVNLLFLDELTAAPLSIQTAAYQIALDRQIGEHKLPSNTFVIAAGNRGTDATVVYDMPSALRNRFMHFELTIELDSWLIWAKETRIHPDLIQYLEIHPERFVSESMKENLFVTPRSWELLSHVLWTWDGISKTDISIIASLVGNELAAELTGKLLSINLDHVLTGKSDAEPLDLSSIQGFVERAGKRIDEIMQSVEKTTNLLRFLERLPFDYAIRLFQMMLQVSSVPFDLELIPEYSSMIRRLETIDA